MKLFFEYIIKPRAIKLRNTIEGRTQIVVHYYPQEDELGWNEHTKSYTWRPF